MVIGTIVKSNSHISYMCRVYGKLDTRNIPEPHQYALSTFVSLSPTANSSVRLVGVVRDTLLLNPEYGNLGPRLSPEGDLSVFSPDYVNEKGIVVDILVLGWLEGERSFHGVPALAATIGAPVEVMSPHNVCRFHCDSKGKFLIGYLPQLITRNDPMIASLLLTILERLEPDFPEQRRVINVLKNNLAWKARVVPTG